MSPGGTTPPGDTVRDQLLERERWLLRPGTREETDAVIAAGFVEVGASGRRWDRASILDLLEQRHREGGRIDVEIDEVDCRALGGGAHLLTYTTRADGGRVRRASIWELVDGRWRIGYHQGTPVPP